MKRFQRIFYSNKFLAFLMLLMQVAVFVAMFVWINDYSNTIAGLSTAISAILVIYIVNRSDEPTFKMTWITLIVVIPVFGVLFYLFSRRGFISKNIMADYMESQAINKKYLSEDTEVVKELEETDTNEASFVRYLSKYGGSPVYKDTAVQYYPLGERMFEDIKRELLKAEKFIFMEFFIINTADRMWKETLEILRMKARAGVEVRVMFDGMGCVMTMPTGYDAVLRRQGIKCHIFSPIVPLLSTHQNNRDHRKIIVIDNKVAFTGGINMADEYINAKERFGHWKDTGVMLRGNATQGFTNLFLEMWNVNNETKEDGERYITEPSEGEYGAGGYVVPFGDTPLDNVYVGKRAYIHNLDNASDYVYIMTPYLAIDNEMYESMKYAAARGVDVKIIMPHIPDKKYALYLGRTYYKELLEAGVEVYEYTPGFIHAKVSVSDGKRAIVGTINHDFRSLYLHYECAAYMYNTTAILSIENDFKQTLEKSEKITLEKLSHFNIFTRLLGNIMRLVAPLI